MNDATKSEQQFQALTPYLIVKGAARAIDFYTRAFGAVERFRLEDPNGLIGHAELQVRDSLLMLADEWPEFGALSPPTVGGSPVSLHLRVDDVDECVARAIAAGATVLRAVKEEFYGSRTGMIVDPFGHRWHIATKLRDVSPDEMQEQWRRRTS